MKVAIALAALVLATAGTATRSAPAPQAPAVAGEVLEVKDVEIYSYLRLKTKDGEIWAAVPKAPVKKGDKVAIGNPMVMQNFESKTLHKTFDKIVFGSIVDPNAKPAAAMAAPAVAAPGSSPPAVKVAKATGPDARTVAEVVAGKAALKGKTVLVHAQAVKVNLGIMGKNWIHLRDGSGSAGDGTNDILVTTKDAAAVGDVVNARGTVRTDVNLGSGYTYAVIIEDASLRK
jgi:hypothetical protein